MRNTLPADAFRSDEVSIARDLANMAPEARCGQSGFSHLFYGYKSALDSIADIVCTDREGTITYVNATFCAKNKCSPDDAVGKNNRIFSSGIHGRGVYKEMWSTIAAGAIWRGELCNKALDGTLYWTDTTIAPRRNERGDIVGYIGLRTDISERKFAQQRLLEETKRRRRSESLFRDVVECLPNGVLVHDRSGNLIYRNRTSEREAGSRGLCLDARAARNSSSAAMSSVSYPTFGGLHQLPNGRWLKVDERVTTAGRLVLVHTDVTDMKSIEQELLRRTEIDSLTGICNRASFMRQLTAAVTAPDATPFAVAMIDLDGFKGINDSFGHDVGDGVLKHFANVLRKSIRKRDVAGRLGGDEFAILLRDTGSAQQLREVISRIYRELSKPLRIRGSTIRAGATTGVARFPKDASDAETLLKYADIALYHAKGSCKSGHVIFDGNLKRTQLRRCILGRDLRQALEGNGVEVALQPQRTLHGDRHLGFEALLRWRRGRREISPTEVIAIAEAENLTARLSARIIDAALEFYTALRGQGLDPGILSLNVGATQLLDLNFAAELHAGLQSRNISASLIEVEVTENVILDRSADLICKVLEEISSLGSTIALDDFGTGYASLTHLKRFPLNRIKIDRSFVAGVVDRADDRVIVNTIITLAHSLGLSVVAEGVETQEQLEILCELGCDSVQGYLTGRPMSLAGAAAYLGHSQLQGAAH